MANTKISALTEATLPLGGDLFPIVQTPTGTPVTKYVKGYHLVEMGERNYKFVVTIASNNITVALKNLAGNDFSAVDPCVVKIGNTWRTITAALSVTVNAGANSFNAGATELLAQAIDYFVYLGYRTASTAVVIGFSRIPWANVYSDFSATATNEKYGAFSTAPASTDDVVNIGRMRATNSGTTSFNWTSISQSAPTSENTIQRPVFETSTLTYNFVGSNLTTTSGTINLATYQIIGRRMVGDLRFTLGASSAVASTAGFLLPFSYFGINAFTPFGGARYDDTSLGAAWLGALQSGGSANLALFLLYGTASTYSGLDVLSSTAPFTWATTDVIRAHFDTAIGQQK